MYALTCEHRWTFSGYKSTLNNLYSNFTADVDNAWLFLHRKRVLAHKTKTRIFLFFIFVFLFIDVIWLRPRSKSAGLGAGNFSVHLHLTGRTWD